MTDKANQATMANLKVSVAIGNSSSESTSTQTWSQAQGGKLNAGGNIPATSAG